MNYSKQLIKIAELLKESIVKKCPKYKGKGYCVYPHKPGVSVGEGTG